MGTPGGVYEYDADQIAIELGGIKVDSGFADGSFLKITYDAKFFEKYVGTDSSFVRSKTNNKVAMLSFILNQASPINDQLSALHNVDRAAPNGAGIVPLMVKDLNGTTLHAAAHAYIEQFPESEFERKAKEREWSICAPDLVSFVGSNPKL